MPVGPLPLRPGARRRWVTQTPSKEYIYTCLYMICTHVVALLSLSLFVSIWTHAIRIHSHPGGEWCSSRGCVSDEYTKIILEALWSSLRAPNLANLPPETAKVIAPCNPNWILKPSLPGLRGRRFCSSLITEVRQSSFSFKSCQNPNFIKGRLYDAQMFFVSSLSLSLSLPPNIYIYI